jgi:tmRNA-binding protein
MNKAEQILETILDYVEENKFHNESRTKTKKLLLNDANGGIAYIFNRTVYLMGLQLYLKKKIPDIKFYISGCDSLNDIINNHTNDRLC